MKLLPLFILVYTVMIVQMMRVQVIAAFDPVQPEQVMCVAEPMCYA